MVERFLGKEEVPSSILGIGSSVNQPKTQIKSTTLDDDEIYLQLKKLKELFGLDILTKQEYDKKAKELKEKIL